MSRTWDFIFQISTHHRVLRRRFVCLRNIIPQACEARISVENQEARAELEAADIFQERDDELSVGGTWMEGKDIISMMYLA